MPVGIVHDLAVGVDPEGADAWALQDVLATGVTVGAPPDTFNQKGQDWGLPPWRADVMAQRDFTWMRARARRYADLYDGFRIDHLVGLYRMYVRPIDKSTKAFFDPAEEPSQIALGETLVGILRSGESSPDVIAEDLGSIPPFVRESMGRLDLPGLKVLRWERHWDRDGKPPIDPAEFPECSVATTGTHDIEPLAATPDGETEEKRIGVLRSMLSAGSILTLIPLQDVFGWTDRINTPAVVDEINWTWRVPWPVDAWLDREDTVARADQLKAWTREADR
jgi:4-alpha-glucanotransferase